MRDIVAEINAENEKKWGKIKECCELYPPFCRCYKTPSGKQMVRFPNESYPVEMNLEKFEFQFDRESDSEIFGWYKGNYIALQK